MENNNYKQIIKVKYTDRIDKYISDNSNISRSDVKKLIEGHAIICNKIFVRKGNFKVKENDEILVADVIQKEINAKPENIPIEVIYEDDDLIIINKESGMVVHPAPGNFKGTLVNALLFRFKNLSNINGDIRPGIVHRIDKDTSGLLVVAKNNETHRFLSEELKNHNIKRVYYALIEGRMENEITHINLPIGRDKKNRKKMCVTNENSKNALTHVFIEKVYDDYSLVRCELETGRTHQIRVHLSYLKHPIIGDPLYGKNIDNFGQRLHAAQLRLIHPKTKKEIVFDSPIPTKFRL